MRMVSLVDVDSIEGYNQMDGRRAELEEGGDAARGKALEPLLQAISELVKCPQSTGGQR